MHQPNPTTNEAVSPNHSRASRTTSLLVGLSCNNTISGLNFIVSPAADELLAQFSVAIRKILLGGGVSGTDPSTSPRTTDSRLSAKNNVASTHRHSSTCGKR